MKLEQSMTVMDALARVQRASLLVPAMQREFVWKDEQITALFDSAMRGYPIGTLLLWRVSRDVARRWPWFACHTDLDRSRPVSKPTAAPLDAKVDAILDGQQRVTAFNIGVYGSITVRSRNGTPPQKRQLWLNAAHPPEQLEPGAVRYQFAFHPSNWSPTDGVWVRVRDATAARSRSEVRALLGRRPAREHVDVIERLRHVMNTEPVIAWQVLEDDDLDAVLNIFIRANTKGTQLGYDDMLLAIANTTWRRDANEAVRSLRRGLDREFRLPISQTRIMKSGLVLSGAQQVGFRAANLTRARLRAIDDDWEAISQSIWVATKALWRFGITQRTLTAENVVIPIATYVHHRHLDGYWVDSGRNAKDLERVRRFVFRSLLQPDFWTGAVDALLIECRNVIQSRPIHAHFPLAEISAAIARSKLGKRLEFGAADIERLLATRYGDRHALLLLTAMYPDAARQGWLDKDHVFPRSKFNENALRTAGIDPARLTELRDRGDQLPNLCLLSPEDNKWWKQARLPAQWLDEVAKQAGRSQRSSRIRNLDLQHAPASIVGFDTFWDRRRDRMRSRLRAVLGSNRV